MLKYTGEELDAINNLDDLFEDMQALMDHFLGQSDSDLHNAYRYVVDRKIIPDEDFETLNLSLSNLSIFIEVYRHFERLIPSHCMSKEVDKISRAANLYFNLEFGEASYCSNYKYENGNTTSSIFSLDDMAFLSGRSIGSIRNSVSKKEIKTTTYENVVHINSRGNKIIEDNKDEKGAKGAKAVESIEETKTVFVEREEALRWLKSKHCFESPKENTSENSEQQESDRRKLILEHGEFSVEEELPAFLLLKEKGELKTYKSFFGHINESAKIVLCGITPGKSQACLSLNTYRKALEEGLDEKEAKKRAKESASFAGTMRTNLVRMLDHVSLNSHLDIESCAALFEERKDLVHYTSALQNPVFYKGGNYNGTPGMLKDSSLIWQIEEYLIPEVSKLDKNAIFIPLGPKPAEVLHYLVSQKCLKEHQILDGFPHPSGANAERIKYFCEEKPKDQLSIKTNAMAIDQARQGILNKLDILVSG